MRVVQQSRDEEPNEIEDGQESNLLSVQDARLHLAEQTSHRDNSTAETKSESAAKSVTGSGWAHHYPQQHKYIQELLNC